MCSFCINLERRTWSHWFLHPNCRTGIARCVLPTLCSGMALMECFGYSKALQQIKAFREQLLDHLLCLENRIKTVCSSFCAAFSPCDLAFCQVCSCSPRRFPLLDLIVPFVVLPFPFSLPAPQPLCSLIPCPTHVFGAGKLGRGGDRRAEVGDWGFPPASAPQYQGSQTAPGLPGRAGMLPQSS